MLRWVLLLLLSVVEGRVDGTVVACSDKLDDRGILSGFRWSDEDEDDDEKFKVFTCPEGEDWVTGCWSDTDDTVTDCFEASFSSNWIIAFSVFDGHLELSLILRIIFCINKNVFIIFLL